MDQRRPRDAAKDGTPSPEWSARKAMIVLMCASLLLWGLIAAVVLVAL